MQKPVYPPKKVHYSMIRDDEKFVVDKLDRELGFYRIYFEKRIKGLEIVYDTPSKLLSGAGIVLSKQYEGNEIYFKLRKISTLPGALKRPTEKFVISKCKKNELPKDYPLQIATAINNAFANIFTIDLVEVVKQTVPIYEIKVTGNLYSLTSGIGMKGQLVFEKARYKDLVNGRKVTVKGATVTLPDEPKFKKDQAEVLDAIDRKCKELLIYEESRFEIAQRLLRPKKPAENRKKMILREKKQKNNENNEQNSQKDAN